MHRALLVLLLAGCSSKESTTAAPPIDAGVETAAQASVLDKAMPYLIGTFDSADQAKADPQYQTVYLAQCEIAVPELGAHVLYVEQAIFKKNPYRQRVYLVEQRGDDAVVNRIFKHVDETKLINLCDDPTRVQIAAADLVEKKGCEVTLTWSGDRFKGGTSGKGCSAAGWGSSIYMTSEAELDDKTLTSWDRGYDATDKQVEGARKGPYVFVRRSPFEAR